jgi:hypothetical protein
MLAINSGTKTPPEANINCINPLHLTSSSKISLSKKDFINDKKRDTSKITNVSEFSVLGSFSTVIMFCASTATIMFLYVAADIWLADPPPNNFVDQNKWDSRWWSVPPQQSLFFLSICCSIAEATLKCSRKGRKKRLVDRLSYDVFVVLFLSMAIVQFFYPTSYKRYREATVLKVERGNCSLSNKIISGGTKFHDICYTFKSSDFIQLQSNLNSKVQGIDVEYALDTAAKLQQYAMISHSVIFSGTEKISKMYPNAIDSLFRKKKCFSMFPDLGCESFYSRCVEFDCSPVPDHCGLDKIYEEWRQCGENECNIDPPDSKYTCEIPHAVAREVVQMFETTIKRSEGKELGSSINAKELSLVRHVCSELLLSSKRSEILNNTMHNNTNSENVNKNVWKKRECNLKFEPSKFDEATSTVRIQDLQTNNESTSCNENVTTYQSKDGLSYNDQILVNASTLIVLCILVIFSGHTPTFPRPETVRVLSCAMGYVVSFLTFSAALNVERASQDNEKTNDQKLKLEIWSGIYFFVAWACSNHALFMFFPDSYSAETENDRKQSNFFCIKNCLNISNQILCKTFVICKCIKKEKNALPEKSTTIPGIPSEKDSGASDQIKREASRLRAVKNQAFHSVKSMSFGAKYLMTEVMSSRGKWFMIKMMTKELFESVFQFLALINTASVTDATSVLIVGSCISLNLISLNAMNLILRRTKGKHE